MGLKKLNSEYNSCFKTFRVQRPVTTKAKLYPTDTAPETLDSSRRAGLLSNQFSQVTEPALQRKRIVPYKYNHNILSTNTVKELSDNDWLETVGNEEDEVRNTKNKKDSAYKVGFDKLKIADESPVELASKTRDKKKSTAMWAEQQRALVDSLDRLPAAGIATYTADPRDKRLLRHSDNHFNPHITNEELRSSMTEYTTKFDNGSTCFGAHVRTPPSTRIDMAIYEKALQQRQDAYGLSVTPNRDDIKQRVFSRNNTLQHKESRPKVHVHGEDFKRSRSNMSAVKEKYTEKPHVSPRSKKNSSLKSKSKMMRSQQGDLDEKSLNSSIIASRERNSSTSRQTAKKKAPKSKENDSVYDAYVASPGSSSTSPQKISTIKSFRRHNTRQRSVANNTSNSEPDILSSHHSLRSYQRTNRKENQTEYGTKNSPQNMQNKHRVSRKQAWQTEIVKGLNAASKYTYERGRSPTPEMRTAGQSRRHHLDITTGSNNPLSTYDRIAYDPTRYSDVSGSLTSGMQS